MTQAIKQITVHELSTLLEDNNNPIELIDVREPFERDIAHIGGKLIPLNTLPNALHEITKDKPVVVYCRSGGRSQMAAKILMDNGFNDVANLSGGLLAWINEIDASLTRY